MPNPFKDWARMYGANKQYLESQGRPSSFLGQIGDIPTRIHEAANASEIGIKMIRHAELANGAGLRATVTIEGIWQVGSYLNMSPARRRPVPHRLPASRGRARFGDRCVGTGA
jgi:hypothetical protein